MEYLIAILLIIIATVIGFFKWWGRKCRLYWEKRGVRYSSGNLISGIFQIFKKPIHEIVLEGQKKQGRIYGHFEILKPVLTVSEPDLLRDILVKDFPVFNMRRELKVDNEIISKAVSVMNGDDWKRVRTIITPAFTSKRMRQMTHIINEVSNTVVDVLGKHADEGKTVEFRRYQWDRYENLLKSIFNSTLQCIFAAYTLDVIAKAAFATKIDTLNNPDNDFLKEVKRVGATPSLFRVLLLVILPEWLRNRLRIGFLPPTDYFRSVVLQVIKERKETGKKYDDMLQLFLDAKENFENEKSKEAVTVEEHEDETDQFGSVTNSEMQQRTKYKKMSEEELIAQCVMFLLAGYGTTTATLSFIVYCLAVNPECQEKLTAEIDEVFEKHKELSYDAVRDMKYLDCVISETLRMYPSAIRSERTACEDYKLGNTGITIEKGTIVGFNIHAMHHDPEFFPNPEKFYPERFLSENATHPQYAYLPFGAGPRNCLGMRFALMEIKFCISQILRHYSLKISEKTKVPLEFKKFTPFMDIEELFLDLERRNV